MYNIQVPGFEEVLPIRTVKRNIQSQAHQTRLAQVRKAAAHEQAERERRNKKKPS